MTPGIVNGSVPVSTANVGRLHAAPLSEDTALGAEDRQLARQVLATVKPFL